MGTVKTVKAATGRGVIEYPESDGKPMAETDLHRDEMFDLIERLKARHAARPDVYVSGNLLRLYEEGKSRAAVAPDVFVVLGVPQGRRRIHKLWQEGRPPALVIEVTSRKTRREDQVAKKALYARLGVQEYFLYDPEGDYLAPALQGYRLVGGEYRMIAAQTDGALRSEALYLDLRLEAGRLELYEAGTGARLLRPIEAVKAERLRAAAGWQRAEVERLRAEVAEAELARLRGQGGADRQGGVTD